MSGTTWRSYAASLGFCAALIGSAMVAPVASAAITRTEVWRGAYQCAQGMTGVTLTLLLQPDGKAQGLFEFYPLASNPAVAQGCFEMSGFMDGSRRLTLSPGLWRREPPGYVGTIQGPGCAAFALVRQTMPDEPSACSSLSS
jgi:hypothetical protein